MAIKTVAHKLAQAFCYILRDGTDFEVGRGTCGVESCLLPKGQGEPHLAVG